MPKTTCNTPELATLLLVLALAACGGGGPADTPTTTAAAPPAVVIVAMDGLRADAPGFASGTAATPRLDALAARSVRFRWAFAQAPEMTTSLASMLSGLYPTTNGKIDAGAWMADEAVTLAEVLGAAGWQTAAFIAGDGEGSDRGLAQGFATFELGPQPGARAAEWLGDNAGNPVLLLVGGLSAVDEAEEASYADRVAAMDERLGAFLDQLATAGRGDHTTLVVLGSNGVATQEGAADALSVKAACTHVPLLLQAPGRAAADVDKVVELVDLMPTVLELVGVAAPEGLQGASLVAVVEDRGTPPYIAFGESRGEHNQYYAALAGYQLVQRGGAVELYNMAEDPLEQIDLAAGDEKRVKVLRQHLDAWKKLVSATSLDPELRTGTLDEDTVEQLKSLGYIQ